MDLKQLILDLIKGNEKAQWKFFELTADRMMGVAMRYTKDRNTSKDVLQEAYIRIYDKLPGFEYRSARGLQVWMSKIVSREAIRWIKANQRYSWTEEVPVENLGSKSREEDPFFQSDLMEYLNKLPEAHRIVFNLYIIEGYSHKEIEEITGIAEVTARSHLSRARKKLQNLMNDKVKK